MEKDNQDFTSDESENILKQAFEIIQGYQSGNVNFSEFDNSLLKYSPFAVKTILYQIDDFLSSNNSLEKLTQQAKGGVLESWADQVKPNNGLVERIKRSLPFLNGNMKDQLKVYRHRQKLINCIFADLKNPNQNPDQVIPRSHDMGHFSKQFNLINRTYDLNSINYWNHSFKTHYSDSYLLKNEEFSLIFEKKGYDYLIHAREISLNSDNYGKVLKQVDITQKNHGNQENGNKYQIKVSININLDGQNFKLFEDPRFVSTGIEIFNHIALVLKDKGYFAIADPQIKLLFPTFEQAKLGFHRFLPHG